MGAIKQKPITTAEKLKIGMAQVKVNLMAYKKAKNSELVVLQGDKVVFLKPEYCKSLAKLDLYSAYFQGMFPNNDLLTKWKQKNS